MNDKTKALVERVEHNLSCTIAGCSRCFRNGRSLFGERKALADLCAAVRSIDAENERLRTVIDDMHSHDDVAALRARLDRQRAR